METKELRKKLNNLPFASKWVVTASIVDELLKMETVDADTVKSVTESMIDLSKKHSLYIERGAA